MRTAGVDARQTQLAAEKRESRQFYMIGAIVLAAFLGLVACLTWGIMYMRERVGSVEAR